LQPQDFVDEWLTRPWSEMQSSSDGITLEKLKKWHDFLGGELTSGEFGLVLPCVAKPGYWQGGVEMYSFGEKDLPEPLDVYFLVQQSEQYRFKMIKIGFDQEDDCPGEGRPDLQGPIPSLFPRAPIKR